MGVCVHNDIKIYSAVSFNLVDNVKNQANTLDYAYHLNPTEPSFPSNTIDPTNPSNTAFHPFNLLEEETRMTIEISKFSNSAISSTMFQEKASVPPKSFKRVHIFGSRQSGKSSFLIRVCEKRFEHFYIPSIFVETNTCKCVVNGYRRNIEFNVKKFEQFNLNDINLNDFIFVFFDESNENSLLQAKQFIAFLRDIDYLNRINLYLVGNKSELKNYSEDEQQLDVFCNAYNAKLFHISVKDNTGIPILLKSLN